MKSAAPRACASLLLLAITAGPLAFARAQEEAGEASAETPATAQALVLFESPAALTPALGDVLIQVQVFAEAVERVRFLVDGEEVGAVAKPPYRLPHSLGDDVGPHRFEAIVETTSGEAARAVRETPGLAIDDTIDLGLRQLYVTIGGSKESERPLAVEDFVIRDDGRREEIVTFEGGDAALTVALLVDASESMRGGRLEAALEGARSFLAGMRELDEAAIYLFADVIHHRTASSQDATALGAEVAQVEADGGTALNDALYAGIRGLEARQGRRVVVLLSDGLDIHSALGIEDILWIMRRSQSVVYWIALQGGPTSVLSPWRSSEEHAAERDGLLRLVEESGGRIVPISETADAQAAFGDILAELRRQYVLGYYPSVRERDGRWHRVDVRVRGVGLRARTRGGYVDW